MIVHHPAKEVRRFDFAMLRTNGAMVQGFLSVVDLDSRRSMPAGSPAGRCRPPRPPDRHTDRPAWVLPHS